MKVAHTNWLNGGTAMSNIAKCVIITLMTSSLVGVVAATDTYVIYPNDGSNTDQTDAIYKELQGIVNGGDIFTSSSHHFGVNYWRTDFTSADADTMKGNQDVASVELSCTKDCYDPTTFPASRTELEPASHVGIHRRAPTAQSNAADEMVFISQEQGKSLADMNHQYLYDDIAGEGVTVYILDTGAVLDRDEFTKGENVAQKVRWIKVGAGQQPSDDSSVSEDGTGGKGHGTCMLSKVAGDAYGVAKKASPVLVRVPRFANKEDWLDGLSAITDDLEARSDKGAKSVLSMSFYYPPDQVSPGWLRMARTHLRWHASQGILLVTGSGNAGAHEITGYPAVWGKGEISELLVVGACDNSGAQWVKSSRDLSGIPTVYAPGVDISCPDALNGGGIKTSSGTSDAAATVAGLAAYFWALTVPKTFTPKEMKNYITDLAYPREVENSVPAIYNQGQSSNGKAPGATCRLTVDHPGSCDCQIDGDPSISHWSGLQGTDC